MSRCDKRAIFRLLCRIAFISYIFIVLWETLLGRKASHSVNMLTEPFWEYKRLLIEGKIGMLHDILLNIAMFIPIGALLPVNFRWNLIQMIATSVILSAFIEFWQLFFDRGWCEIDDIFNNTLGACIGYCLFTLFCRYMKFRKEEEK